MQVSGKIDKVINLGDATAIMIEGSSRTFRNQTVIWGIHCTLDRSEQNKVASLTKGNEVMIKGICNGETGGSPNITFKACKIVP